MSCWREKEVRRIRKARTYTLQFYPSSTAFYVALLSLLVGGCHGGGVADRGPASPIAPIDCCTLKPGNAKAQIAIADTASRLVGARVVRSGNRLITNDCAGVTRAVFLAHGIDLYEDSSEQMTGVRRIYAHVRKHGRIHRGPEVSRGDLVFFDNTWDANNDGLENDPLTHVGVIEALEADGTIVFISRTSSAIERYRMNLRWPNSSVTTDGRVFNDFLRRKRAGDPSRRMYLTGQLFAFFGSLTR